jgi:zinc finger HIT domain-containing protein 1
LAGDEDEEGGGKYSKGRGRQTISDKRNLNILGTSPAARKKKSTMNVRTALLYRKNLATLIDESSIASLASSVPTYLTAGAPPSAYPPRMICSVCGYWGLYKCRRCAMPYCDRNCEGVHAETRCERRVV